MEIRELRAADREAVERFVERVPEGDRTFFKEDVAAPDVIEAWTRPGTARAVAWRTARSSATWPSCRCTAGRATSARCG